jgi:hypothetical protein
MTRYEPLLTNDHHADAPTTSSKMSSMLSSLKDSATKANASVRSGLGLPTTESDDNSEANASGVMEEVAEYCPKLTFQQVSIAFFLCAYVICYLRVGCCTSVSVSKSFLSVLSSKCNNMNIKLNHLSKSFAYTRKQRVMGFATTFTLGYLMSFMSFRLIIKLVEGNPAPFVFLYSTGNVLSLLSSMFLSGPERQMKWVLTLTFYYFGDAITLKLNNLCIYRYMFDEKRKMTSIVYLTSLGTSITVCFIPMPAGAKIGILVLCEWTFLSRECMTKQLLIHLNVLILLLRRLSTNSVVSANECIAMVHTIVHSIWKSDCNKDVAERIGNGWRMIGFLLNTKL